MDIQTILADKGLKAKDKTALLGRLLLEGGIAVDELLTTAAAAKDADKATCIEALEFATRQNPQVATPACLRFVSAALAEKAPRVKWEAAKVTGNIAALYPGRLGEAVKNLLANAEHTGTVVRWSAAFALGEIIKLNTKLNKELLPAAEALCSSETKSSIKKIYIAALKKAAVK